MASLIWVVKVGVVSVTADRMPSAGRITVCPWNGEVATYTMSRYLCERFEKSSVRWVRGFAGQVNLLQLDNEDEGNP